MVQRVTTVAFQGIEARAVDVQVQVAPGLPAFTVVGLPDKAVSEARERVRAALVADLERISADFHRVYGAWMQGTGAQGEFLADVAREAPGGR